MNEIDVETWEEFEEHANKLASERSARKSETGLYISDYLFRGHSDSAWSLETTLERFTGKLMTLEEYYRILCATKPQVETYAGVLCAQFPSLNI